ncbi:MAG: alpha/beta hydrolase-fold protein [Pyrinomonadaceae bacterium]
MPRFWAEVKSQGTPLVETIEGDGENLLVTFLWRSPENKYVAVFPMARLNTLRHILSRLPGTDLWYKSYKMRRDARFIYLVSINDSLAPFAVERPGEKGGWIAALRPDPLNLKRYVEPKDPETPGDEDYVGSAVELPDAPSQPFVSLRPGVAKGRVELIRYDSKLLKNRRRIWVYTPPAYERQGAPNRLLILFDGRQYMQATPTPTILDNMIADGRIPPVVAVMVGHVDRLAELAESPQFADFVANELVPWVRQKYRVTQDPRQTVIGGLSLGGLGAAYAALRHPEVFGNVLSQSGSFQHGLEQGGGLIEQFAIKEKVAVRFYLEAGLFEIGGVPSLLHSNRHLRDVLRAKGYEVEYSEFNGRHDHIGWRGSLSQGLVELVR